MPEPLIELTDLCKRYGPRTVLDGVSLQAAAGEALAIIGPSGSGKSTMLRCINGLHDWDAGRVRVGPHTIKAGERARHVWPQVRRLVGMIFQDFQLFPHLTALENVAEAPQRVLRWPRNRAHQRAQELLDRVGLAERAAAYPQQLSGGQKQRVAIARALAMQPQALLCDEITSALDPELKQEVLSVLEGLKRDGLTLLMVTHEIGFARRAADRVVVVAEGRVIEEGPPKQVLDAPQSPRTRQLLAGQL